MIENRHQEPPPQSRLRDVTNRLRKQISRGAQAVIPKYSIESALDKYESTAKEIYQNNTAHGSSGVGSGSNERWQKAFQESAEQFNELEQAILVLQMTLQKKGLANDFDIIMDEDPSSKTGFSLKLQHIDSQKVFDTIDAAESYWKSTKPDIRNSTSRERHVDSSKGPVSVKKGERVTGTANDALSIGALELSNALKKVNGVKMSNLK